MDRGKSMECRRGPSLPDPLTVCFGSFRDLQQDRRIAVLEERIQMLETPPVRGRKLQTVDAPPAPPSDREVANRIEHK